MRIIFTEAEMHAAYEAGNAYIVPMSKLAGISLSSVKSFTYEEWIAEIVKAYDGLIHSSFIINNGLYEFVVSPPVAIRVFGVYREVAGLIVPLVDVVKSLFGTLSEDFNEVTRLLNARF